MVVRMVERRRYYEEEIVFNIGKVRGMGIRLVDGGRYIKEKITILYLEYKNLLNGRTYKTTFSKKRNYNF